MKNNIIDESKLIFWTGAPGSRWSGIAKELCTCSEVDNSDWAAHRTYNDDTHFGNYFGPGMEYGDSFDDMGSMPKQWILTELGKPYSEDQNGRVRILKSHMFSRNLGWIKQNFPTSTIATIWRDNDQCLEWWLEAGGFDITYPDYKYYKNEAVMRDQIIIENLAIVGFGMRGNYTLKKYDINTLTKELGLTNPQEITDSWGSKLSELLVGIYDPSI